MLKTFSLNQIKNIPIALFDWTNKRPQHIHTKFVVHAFSYSLRVSMAVERKKSSV